MARATLSREEPMGCCPFAVSVRVHHEAFVAAVEHGRPKAQTVL